MKILNRQKKKELTDKQKVNRLLYIMIALAVMVILIIIAPGKPKEQTTGTDHVSETMDAALDSLLNATGIPGYTVTATGLIDIYHVFPSCPQEDTLQIVATQIEFLSRLGGSLTGDSRRRLEQYMNKETQLREDIRTFKSINDRKTEKACRRIWFKDRDGDTYTCFQNYEKDTGFHYLTMIMPTGSENPLEKNPQ